MILCLIKVVSCWNKECRVCPTALYHEISTDTLNCDKVEKEHVLLTISITISGLIEHKSVRWCSIKHTLPESLLRINNESVSNAYTFFSKSSRLNLIRHFIIGNRKIKRVAGDSVAFYSQYVKKNDGPVTPRQVAIDHKRYVRGLFFQIRYYHQSILCGSTKPIA